MAAAFLPPKINPLVLAAAKGALPWLLGRYAGGIEVVISEEDLEKLRRLKSERLLLLPNHPTHFDPLVMMEVSRRVEEDFLFVAAREVFDLDMGFHGWLLQRCGVYSLIRGAVDRESFAMTQRVLAEGRHWLVIFIEGEVSSENDSVIPFEAGVVSLALRAQNRLAETSDATIHAVPVAMKTKYKPGVERVLAEAVSRLEEKVLCAGNDKIRRGFASWEQLRERIGRIGAAVLAAVEPAYLSTPANGATIDQRIDALRDRMLGKMEAFLDISPAASGVDRTALLERVRTVRNKMDRIVHAYGEGDGERSAYQRRQLQMRERAFAELYADLTRLVNFLTLRGDYLDRATPERFAEVVLRLEQEILGKPRLLHPRTVTVRVGEMVNLREQLTAFGEDKKGTAQILAGRFEKEMLGLLGNG